MVYKNKFRALLALGIILMASTGTVCAEDLLDKAYKSLEDTDKAAGHTFFALFPGFRTSLNSTLEQVDNSFPFIKGNHWIFYLVFVIALISILVKVWEKSDGYVINSIIGIAALLILLHMFDIAIEITLLRFSLVLILGLAGVLIVLGFHYFNLPL